MNPPKQHDYSDINWTEGPWVEGTTYWKRHCRQSVMLTDVIKKKKKGKYITRPIPGPRRHTEQLLGSFPWNGNPMVPWVTPLSFAYPSMSSSLPWYVWTSLALWNKNHGKHSGFFSSSIFFSLFFLFLSLSFLLSLSLLFPYPSPFPSFCPSLNRSQERDGVINKNTFNEE